MSKTSDITGYHKATGLLPDFYAATVTSIKPALLRRLGVRYLVVDVDHTLAHLNATKLDLATIKALRSLVSEGAIIKIYIASNSRRDLRAMADSIDAEIVRPNPWQRKPSRAYYRKVLRAIGCRPQQALMVGDKLINDIWGGNRAGMYTLLVEPIGPAQWLDRLLGRRFWGDRYLKKYRPKVAGHDADT